MTDIETAFTAAMAVYDLHPPGVIADGKFQRFAGPGERRGKKSGWYRLYPDAPPAGCFGDWRRGFTKIWCSKSRHAMTRQERATLRERVRVTNMERKAEEVRLQEQARAAVAKHWEVAQAVSASHPYVAKKGIRPYGAKQLGQQVLVPMRDIYGVMHNAQYIQPVKPPPPDREKNFKTSGRKTGCFCAVGEATENDPVMLIAEGWATACSLREATGWPVFAAMDVGNTGSEGRSRALSGGAYRALRR